jgi:hypothetical protein
MQCGKTLEMQKAIAKVKAHGATVVGGKKSSNESTVSSLDVYQNAVYRAFVDGDQSALVELGIDPGRTIGVDVSKNGCAIGQ